MKKLLIDQPGRSGDILICLPIAKWYSDEYQVDWLCPEEYHPIFDHIFYCQPVSEITDIYVKVIDMSFGIRQNTELHKWWINNKWQSFINAKYIIADIPLIERWNLVWDRDEINEYNLYQKIINKYGSDYIVVHEKTHDCQINIPIENKVLFEPIEDYTIFDWLIVLSKAKEIHCIDSLLCNFVEVIPEFVNIPKYYYFTSKVPNVWDRTLLINNWRFV